MEDVGAESRGPSLDTVASVVVVVVGNVVLDESSFDFPGNTCSSPPPLYAPFDFVGEGGVEDKTSTVEGTGDQNKLAESFHLQIDSLPSSSSLGC